MPVCVYLYKLVYRYVCNMCDGDIPYKSINVTLVHVYGCYAGLNACHLKYM